MDLFNVSRLGILRLLPVLKFDHFVSLEAFYKALPTFQPFSAEDQNAFTRKG